MSGELELFETPFSFQRPKEKQELTPPAQSFSLEFSKQDASFINTSDSAALLS